MIAIVFNLFFNIKIIKENYSKTEVGANYKTMNMWARIGVDGRQFEDSEDHQWAEDDCCERSLPRVKEGGGQIKRPDPTRPDIMITVLILVYCSKLHNHFNYQVSSG